MSEVVAIAAVARNGVIGASGGIPWHIRADLTRFRQLTTGHVLVMGRKTYDSIGRPLPRRTTVVVTRDRRWRREGVRSVPSVPEALALAQTLSPGPVFVAGGGEIYRAAWARLTRLEITEVDQAPPGEVTFPAIDPAQWVERWREVHEGFTFITRTRR